MGRLLDVKREFAKGEEVFWGIDGSSALCIGFFGVHVQWYIPIIMIMI